MKVFTKLETVFKRIAKDIIAFKWPILLFVIVYLAIHKVFHAFCPMIIITGYPCPGCGMTRAVAYLLMGQFERSFNLNPLAPLWILLGIWFFFRRYIAGKKVKGVYPLMACICIAMIVYYAYRMYTTFPSYPPMVYRRDNILAHLLKKY